MDRTNRRDSRAFFVEEEGVPAYDELILVAHRDRLDDPGIDAFLGAVERAVQWPCHVKLAGWTRRSNLL